jgi:ribosomal protein S18 acetylase RimI-like enzyme
MVEIKIASIEEIAQIVEIHKQAFPNFFLTSLGSDFLSFYYSTVLKSKDVIILCAMDSDCVLGICEATRLSHGFYKKLIMSNIFSFFAVTVKLMFSNPSALLHLIKNLSKTDNSQKDDGSYAELHSLAISPNCQGKGIGKSLLASLEKQYKQEGIKKLSLTTDVYNNDVSIAFYYACGYTKYYDFIAFPNRKMYRLIKEL